MKKYLLITLIALCLIGLFQAGILRALLMFLLVGAIPGTSDSLSPDIMTGILVALCTGVIFAQFGLLMPRIVALYRRYIFRKKLLTIPAFRRLVRTRQA